jgi:hypothetical protein
LLLIQVEMRGMFAQKYQEPIFGPD